VTMISPEDFTTETRFGYSSCPSRFPHSKGRVIIVECKVMRVIIFDQFGNVIHKFGCSKHLEFPNGVVVNDKEEIFMHQIYVQIVRIDCRSESGVSDFVL
jgi:hypothetical protein